jgi:hypothetical protein
VEIKKISATKIIDAPAAAVFAVLADPNQHTELDGGGMVKGPEGEAPPLGGIGQVFSMNMHQDGLGDYRMINTVTAFVPASRIGWGPAMDPDCEAAKNFEGVDVSAATGRLVIRTTSPLSDADVVAAVDEAGYVAAPI